MSSTATVVVKESLPVVLGMHYPPWQYQKQRDDSPFAMRLSPNHCQGGSGPTRISTAPTELHCRYCSVCCRYCCYFCCCCCCRSRCHCFCHCCRCYFQGAKWAQAGEWVVGILLRPIGSPAQALTLTPVQQLPPPPPSPPAMTATTTMTVK